MKRKLPQPFPVLSEKTIIARINKSKETRLNTTKENKTEGITWLQGAKDYLTIAKKSTKISKIAALHNWCISSEKILKSFGLFAGSITPSDIKHQVGHNTPKVIIKMMDKYGDSILIANVLNQQMISHFGELSTYLQKRDKRSKKYFYHNDIRNIPNDMLSDLIAFCNKPDSEIKKEFSVKQLIVDMKENPHKIKMFDIVNSRLSNLTNESKEKIFQTVLDVIPLEQILAYPRLMIISMISSSFFEPSRYPEDYHEYFETEPNVLELLNSLFSASEKLISACEKISEKVEVTK